MKLGILFINMHMECSVGINLNHNKKINYKL